MAKDVKKLFDAFARQLEVTGFLSNLDQLRTEGAVSEEQYAATKEEYERRLETTTEEITQIKSVLKQQMEVKQGGIKARRLELSKLEVKYKVGELSPGKYRVADRKLHFWVDRLEAEAAELNRLISANSATDIGVSPRKPGITASQFPSLSQMATLAKQLKLPSVNRPDLTYLTTTAGIIKKVKLPRFSKLSLIVGILLLISVFLPWIAASETLGTQLDSVPGRAVSDIISWVGIFGGLIIIGTAFLPLPKLRGVLQSLIGLGALAALVYMVIPTEFYGAGAMPLLNEYARTLIVIREGLFLYGIVALMLLVTGAIERKRR
ncbi:hypothetical protein ACFLYX_02060 [Chloroflexota bacterium]